MKVDVGVGKLGMEQSPFLFLFLRDRDDRPFALSAEGVAAEEEEETLVIQSEEITAPALSRAEPAFDWIRCFSLFLYHQPNSSFV